MTGQSHRHSLFEVGLNLVTGFILAWVCNVFLVPWLFGVPINPSQGFGMVILFTVLSILRQYFFRRVFNWWQIQQSRFRADRASGECRCNQCGLYYRDHPLDRRTVSQIDGAPFLHRLCDGRLVKL